MNVAGLTDTGRMRSQNQDAFFASTRRIGAVPNLFIVADGMGGHKAGDVASTQAVERFCYHLADTTAAPGGYVELLVATAHKVNRELYDMAQANRAEMEGMGTTFIACVIEDGRVDVVHVGDSRAYFIAPGKIAQFTADHTYAEEMFRAGEITAEEARTHPKRHHLTRVLGFDPQVVLDGFSRALAGDILLCTDGLSNMLSDEKIEEIANSGASVQTRTQALVEQANANGGTDNITAVYIDLSGCCVPVKRV